MKTTAVVLAGPKQLALKELALTAMRAADVVVDVHFSGISTGTERLLWTGDMPPFPGMGYPLVPGYESVGTIVAAGPDSPLAIGEEVFVPGATCFPDAHCLFGGTAQRLVVAADRVIPVRAPAPEQGVLLALAATAQHALALAPPPDLIVGHGVLGRLLARLALANGGPAPTVWEKLPSRMDGAVDYEVVDPAADARTDYRCIVDASGDPAIIDKLVPHLARGGVMVLAGFYAERLGFDFPPAFMREAQIRVAAEWQRADLERVDALLTNGALSLAGLVSHQAAAGDAPAAYETAFNDPNCLKMIIDWKNNGRDAA